MRLPISLWAVLALLSTLVNAESDCTEMRTRKDYRDLTTDEWSEYANALKALRKEDGLEGYNMFEYYNKKHWDNTATAHSHIPFLFWHRYFLSEYEGALRKVNPRFKALPYWDWSVDYAAPEHASLWSEKYIGASASDGTRAQCISTSSFETNTSVSYPVQHCISRGFNPVTGANSALTVARNNRVSFPPPGTITGMVRQSPTFEDFNQYVHGSLHGVVHVWVGGRGGDMASLQRSALDPAFTMHHGYLDYLFNFWESVHGDQAQYPVLDTEIKPYGLMRDALNTTNFCYVYQPYSGWTNQPPTTTNVTTTTTSVTTTTPVTTTTTPITTTTTPITTITTPGATITAPVTTITIPVTTTSKANTTTTTTTSKGTNTSKTTSTISPTSTSIIPGAAQGNITATSQITNTSTTAPVTTITTLGTTITIPVTTTSKGTNTSKTTSTISPTSTSIISGAAQGNMTTTSQITNTSTTLLSTGTTTTTTNINSVSLPVSTSTKLTSTTTTIVSVKAPISQATYTPSKNNTGSNYAWFYQQHTPYTPPKDRQVPSLPEEWIIQMRMNVTMIREVEKRVQQIIAEMTKDASRGVYLPPPMEATFVQASVPQQQVSTPASAAHGKLCVGVTSVLMTLLLFIV